MSGETIAFVLLAIGRLVSYVAVIVAIGIVAFRLGIVPAAGLPRAVPALETRLHRLGLVAALALLLATAVRLFAQTYSVFGIEDGVTLEFVSIVANQTRWGRVELLLASAVVMVTSVLVALPIGD